MCGIAGIVGQGKSDRRDATVRRMTNSLAHRGPDGEGFFQSPSVSLGHRRLCIIDLETGQQPLCNEDGTIWLTFNGEIYNYRDLREQLRKLGHQFKTQSDSEVIVHAYEEWGPECVERFRGMFAFGLVDQSKQRLMLARDQLGIKPLYYYPTGGRVAFASELPSLLQAVERAPEVSLRALDFFLRYRYIPAPDTGYEGLYKLPPATYQLYDFAGNLLAQREYWQLSFEPRTDRSPNEWLEAFEEALLDSVQAHLVADVPFGAFLSGGVDSTLIVAAMSHLLNGNVTAYTIGFDEANYSEYDYARQAASELGVQLKHEVVRPDLVATLERLFTNYGEPFADTSAVPTWCVADLARRDVPMILSGDGADEAFAGYHRYSRWLEDGFLSDARAFLKYPKRMIRRCAEHVRQGFSVTRRKRWEQHFVGVVDEPRRRRLWKTDHHEALDATCPAFAAAGQEARGLDRLAFAQYVDIKTYLPGDILTKVDIASMQHGLEVRTPFTDVKIMEFAATLPNSEKVGVGSERQMKALPKRSLANRFPRHFVNRNKMGFAIPEAEWMRRGSEVRHCFDDLVGTTNSPLFDYFEPQSLQEMVSEFDDRGVHATSLWSMFALAFWLNQRTSSGQLPQAA